MSMLAVCGPDRSGNPFCGFGMFETGLQCAAKRLEQIAGNVRPDCLNKNLLGFFWFSLSELKFAFNNTLQSCGLQ